MKRIATFLQQVKIRQIISIVIVGAMLILTTACNNGDALGARPNNPPVQMGGNNNPHTMGGDGYTEYKTSTDPKAVHSRSSQSHSSALTGYPAIAQSLPSGVETNEDGLQYRGSAQPNDSAYRVRDANKATDFPAEKQGSIDRSDPNSRIMERIGQQFEEATEFIKEDLDSATGKAIANEKAKTYGTSGNDTVMRKSY